MAELMALRRRHVRALLTLLRCIGHQVASTGAVICVRLVTPLLSFRAPIDSQGPSGGAGPVGGGARDRRGAVGASIDGAPAWHARARMGPAMLSVEAVMHRNVCLSHT